MATITFTVTSPAGTESYEAPYPDDEIGKLFPALGAEYGYQATVPNPAFVSAEETPAETETITNPQTIAEFVLENILNEVKRQYSVTSARFASEPVRKAESDRVKNKLKDVKPKKKKVA